MLLLRRDEHGRYQLVYADEQIPRYGILSHTWGPDEVSFDDVDSGLPQDGRRFGKIARCMDLARQDGLDYIWVDTCCIDKNHPEELPGILDSVFSWYQNAAQCYAFLDDVPPPDAADDPARIDFRQTRWFARGWTLPELLAPRTVKFYDAQGRYLGSKKSLQDPIVQATHIPPAALQGQSLDRFPVAERLAWMAGRRTTRPEDKAYALLGLFHVRMPIVYGEGEDRAMARLRHEIERRAAAAGAPPPAARFDQYRALGTSQSFRLLALSPASEGAEIRGDLCEFAFDRAHPRYNAVSYVWGDEPAIHPVRINGRQALIRPNIFYAIQRMRNWTFQTYLWIDSLCIDQANEQERGEQVSLMADIYQNADNVWIWLGEEDSTSTIAIEYVAELIRPGYRWADAPWWDDYGLMALGRLLDRPWFRRRWVIQEAAFSANSVIFCGAHIISMDDFFRSVQAVQAHARAIPASTVTVSPRLQALGGGGGDTASSTLVRNRPIPVTVVSPDNTVVSPDNNTVASPGGSDRNDRDSIMNGPLSKFMDSPASRLLDIVNHISTKSRLSLEMLAHLATFAETSDPRDAVFSLLNLASDNSQKSTKLIKPDYTQGVLQVYIAFVLHCIRQSDSLDIICRPWAPISRTSTPQHAPTQQTGPNRLGAVLQQPLPSWIRSWEDLPFGSQPPTATSVRLHGRPLVGGSNSTTSTNLGPVYSASGRRKADVSFGIDMLTGRYNGLLFAKGVLLGTVQKVSPRMAGAMISDSCLAVLLKGHSKRYNLEPMPDSVWRVLCADRVAQNIDGYRRPPAAFSDAANYVLDVEGFDPKDRKGLSLDIEDLIESPRLLFSKQFLLNVRDVVWNRRTFWGKGKGIGDEMGRNIRFAGLVPRQAQPSDTICVLHGCSVPVVLRKIRSEDDEGQTEWQLIGEAYVYDFMDGEAIVAAESLGIPDMEFKIR